VTILLDTSAFIRYTQDNLPRSIQRLINKSTTQIIVSVVTPWEIALKPALLKLGISNRAVREGISLLEARLISLTLEHIEKFSHVPSYHPDPFDRMIISQALVENCAVVSSDQRFPLYAREGLKVLWDR
jgi:PIN domain nuclease of toxin-antitoxin system